MKVATVSDFRKDMSAYIDSINESQDQLLLTRSDGVNMVLMPLESFNAYQETSYLLSSSANRARLLKSIKQAAEDRVIPKTLEELASHE